MDLTTKENQKWFQKVAEQQVILTTTLYEIHLVQTTFTCEVTKQTWLMTLEKHLRRANDEIHRLYVEFFDRRPWQQVDDDQTVPED
jgi:hypothetical protein